MGMREFVIRRIIHLFITLWALITIMFFLFRMLPGDPTSIYITSGMTAEQREATLARLGLDKPLHQQYIDYIAQILTGDFGLSYTYNEPVNSILITKFWNTIFLMVGAYTIAMTGAIIFGALLAWKRNTKYENVGIIVPFLFRSMPEFWIGILLIMIFVFQLGWFPVGGFAQIGATFDTFWDRYLRWGFIYHMVLPLLTGALYSMGASMLVMRNSMLEILDADFIVMKEAEGLSKMTILYKHAVRNSLLPMITVGAIGLGKAVGGQVLIEVVFNWPGMGQAMVNAVFQNDYQLAMGAFFLMGVAVVTLNFLADLLYAYMDPRVSYD